MSFSGNFMSTTFKQELLQGIHNFFATTTDSTVDTTNTDATVTMDSTAAIRVGQNISGTGIPSGAKIASITNATTFEISDAATGSGTNITATFSGDTYKLALYTNSAVPTDFGASSGTTMNADVKYYATNNEVSSSGTNYSAGGGTLTNVTPTTSSTTALTDFADLTFGTATITARGAIIYNTSKGYVPSGSTPLLPAAVVLDFGGDKTSTAGDFTVVFPTADSSNAIIRIA